MKAAKFRYARLFTGVALFGLLLSVAPTGLFADEAEWYTQYGPDGTGDVVQIGTMYVASKMDGTGCAENGTKNWNDAIDWANGLSWLDKDDWRIPIQDELS